MDIAALIRTTKGDRTYDQIAVDCGDEPSSKRLQQIATSPPKEFPKPETVRALARGLRVSERQIVLAWSESLGIRTAEDGGRLAQLLPPSAAHLDDEQIAAVLAVIKAMRADRPETWVKESRAKTAQLEPHTGASLPSDGASPDQVQP